MVEKEPITVDPPYEAGRGLITLEGPSGMFINPTSATLPRGAFTLQYCVFFPNSDTEVVGHGALMAYGITDWLELGAIGNYIDAANDREFGLGGPMVRIRLTKDEGWMPQISIGAYGKYGTLILNQTTAFLAAYKRIPIDENGFVKALGLHVGGRVSWYDSVAAESNSVIGYFGGELQLPLRLYLVGEISTEGKGPAGRLDRIPYAFGVQWRAGAINISTAMIQNGSESELGFYFGIGTALTF